jgi:hypothetical protein
MSSVWHSNNPFGMSGHHFFAVLIVANEFRAHIRILIRRFKLDYRRCASDCIATENGPMKLKSHLARNEVHVAADLCGNRCGQQTMNHQPALLVRGNVMFTLIAGDPVKEPNVFFSKCSLPVRVIANLQIEPRARQSFGQSDDPASPS